METAKRRVSRVVQETGFGWRVKRDLGGVGGVGGAGHADMVILRDEGL